MKLNLQLNERVRNIRAGSTRAGWQGTVIYVTSEQYVIKWDRGEKQTYLRRFSHQNLERIHSDNEHAYARQEIKALNFMENYGSGRKTLKRERRNVITGLTQSEMTLMFGPAKGGVMFNTRVLGRSTGQAFRILGDAMCNPGVAIRYEGVDHAISEGTDNRHHLNKHFEQILRDTIGGLKGFTLDQGHVTFHPIVTEETYVTQ